MDHSFGVDNYVGAAVVGEDLDKVVPPGSVMGNNREAVEAGKSNKCSETITCCV